VDERGIMVGTIIGPEVPAAICAPSSIRMRRRDFLISERLNFARRAMMRFSSAIGRGSPRVRVSHRRPAGSQSLLSGPAIARASARTPPVRPASIAVVIVAKARTTAAGAAVRRRSPRDEDARLWAGQARRHMRRQQSPARLRLDSQAGGSPPPKPAQSVLPVPSSARHRPR
jgi:hypothetical protein